MDGHCWAPPLLPKDMPSPGQTLAAATHIREFWAIFLFAAVMPEGIVLKYTALIPCFSCNSLKVRFHSVRHQMREKLRSLLG